MRRSRVGSAHFHFRFPDRGYCAIVIGWLVIDGRLLPSHTTRTTYRPGSTFFLSGLVRLSRMSRVFHAYDVWLGPICGRMTPTSTLVVASSSSISPLTPPARDH